MDYNILLGGAAGQGVETMGHILAKTLKKLGFYVFLHRDYMSRIRGGHNFVQIRFSNQPIFAHADDLTVIIALNLETASLHYARLVEQSRIIAVEDGDKINTGYGSKIITLPIKQIVQKTGNRRVSGTAAVACALRLFNMPLAPLLEQLKDFFSEEVLLANKTAAEEGYTAAQPLFASNLPNPWENIFINGNEAIAMGALAAGCRFYAGYPMTPSTSIITYLSKKSRQATILVEQAEDEIAVINMALGASFAGLRAMVGSSGGGFSLMVEGVSLAGMTETPVVIVVSQRPGPATGFPTRTEQGELGFVIHSGHGEFPRMVIALRHPEDAFCQTVRAFNIAEKYQVPVFLLTDQYLADYTMTIKPFDFSSISIDRHFSYDAPIEQYLRYKLTESGISPRIIPGKIPGQLVYLDSDEHDEAGHITESAAVRKAMVDKRLKKGEALRSELVEPEYIGSENPEVLLIAWGSTYGPVKESVLLLNARSLPLGALIFGDIWPLPTKELVRLAQNARKIVNLEQNATGQLAALVRQQAMITCHHSLLKYDGRQWSKDEIVDRIMKEVW
ncbi:MAG: 2-oxoacid:acceptor oxidoreductase subunit alpha [Dehalococcoidia bacterium]|nr:2-oxoglutarate oxidoreductase subunit KorA [Chloroflexota bacterium]MBT9160352.1 2-oxoglutarate oxidoreductase subunit KorA [Chloroflexota bacterium]MBT9162441.1 2-oxoglutarate oxidoreductase subunit KorA [Chloroflexota bacterium]